MLRNPRYSYSQSGISDEPAPKEIEESRRQTDIGTIIRFDRFNLSFFIICGKGNISKQ